MANVFDVAKYILEKQGCISTWKLQKLCYYSQAWSLAWTGEPLFQEDFEAGSNGPVGPELFKVHRGKFVVCPEDIPDGVSSSLSIDQIDTIDHVLEHYGDWEPFALREQTHGEKPWKDARGDLPEGSPSSVIITKDSMGEYYGAL